MTTHPHVLRCVILVAALLLPALVVVQRQIIQLDVPPFGPESSRMRIEAASPYLAPQQIEAYQQMLDRQGAARQGWFFSRPLPGNR